MSAFLSPDDVVKLTGYLRPSDQSRWLKKRGLRHWLNARKEVVVPRAEIEGKISSRKSHQGPDIAGYFKDRYGAEEIGTP
jgi:hypothetical protein